MNAEQFEIRARALELAIGTSDGSLDAGGIVKQAAIFEAYLLAGTGDAATVPAFPVSQTKGFPHMTAQPSIVQQALAALSDKIAAEASVIDGAVALIDGFKDRISALITPRTDPDTVQQINHLLDVVGAESDKLSTAVAAGTMAGSELAAPGVVGPVADVEPSGKFNGTNGSAAENADYMRGLADSGEGKAAENVPAGDRANQAYTDGYFAASRAALNAGVDQAGQQAADNAAEQIVPDVSSGAAEQIVPPSTVPPDAPADVPTPESVAGADEQPPAPAAA